MKVILPPSRLLNNGSHRITTALETLTRAQAEASLRSAKEDEHSNRDKTDEHVDRLSRDMIGARWLNDGAPLRFDWNGVLRDGQHRLSAFLKSGLETMEFVVVRGLDPRSFATMDGGMPRDLMDNLGILGRLASVGFAGAIVALASYRASGGRSLVYKSGLTVREKLEVLEKEPDLETSGIFVREHIGARPLLAPRWQTILHYLFSRKDAELADLFVTGLRNGFDAQDHPTFHRFREKLVEYRGMRGKQPRGEYMGAVAIKAWNGERDGQGVKVFRWITGEVFPEIK